MHSSAYTIESRLSSRAARKLFFFSVCTWIRFRVCAFLSTPFELLIFAEPFTVSADPVDEPASDSERGRLAAAAGREASLFIVC
jgi:hypothetical protein